MKNPGTLEELFTKSQFHKSLYTSLLFRHHAAKVFVSQKNCSKWPQLHKFKPNSYASITYPVSLFSVFLIFVQLFWAFSSSAFQRSYYEC